MFGQFSEPPQAPVSPPTGVVAAAAPAAAAAAAASVSTARQPAFQAASSMRKSPGRNEQQLNYLLERQKEFKQAALKSKQQGDLEGAKNYLRMSKVS